MSVDQGLAHARFSGAMRAGTAKAAAEGLAAFFAEAKPAASLIDYVEADLAFKQSALGRTVRQVAARQGGLAAPAAYIVRYDELPLWRAHARALCGAGLLRAAFSEPEKARAWAAEMAALAEAQAIHRALWR